MLCLLKIAYYKTKHINSFLQRFRTEEMLHLYKSNDILSYMKPADSTKPHVIVMVGVQVQGKVSSLNILPIHSSSDC